MRKSILALLLVVTIHVLAFGQARPTAGRLMGGSAVPTGSCNSSSTRTDIYVRSGVPAASSVYLCNAGSWVLFAGGGTILGTSTRVLFFDGTDNPAGDAGLTYDKTTDTLTITGLLKTGSTPVTITDAAGKVLSAALNTVQVANGGTGLTTLTSNTIYKGNGASALAVSRITDDGTTVTIGSGTAGGSQEFGSNTGDTAASFLKINSGDAASNAEPGYLHIRSSHGTKHDAFLFPCTDANGVFCIAGATPVADATNHILTTNNSATVTGKDFNAASSGNVLTSTHKTWFQGAGINNATVASFFDLPTSLAPTPTAATGTNTQTATLDFPDSDGAYQIQTSMMLPSDWSGLVDAKIRWKSAATSGDVVWNVATICVADGETDDPSWNTSSTTTDTAKGTTLQMNDAVLTSVIITGCSAGELMHVQVSRDRTAGADTITGVVKFMGLELTVTRVQ